MASVVDICNLALSHLGDRATVASIDPPEGSAQAEHCARHYPQARDTALQEYTWGFSTTRRALAQMTSPVPGWSYAYALPADALIAFEVLPEGSMTTIGKIGFDMEADDLTGLPLVLTQEPNAVIRYGRRITDASRFSPLFVDALSWLLASKLAGPVVKGKAGADQAARCYQIYQQILAKAATKDANQSTTSQAFVPSSIAARGGHGSGTIELDRFTRTEPWSAYPDGLGRF